MNQETIAKLLQGACDRVYAEQKQLIDEEASERDIASSHIAPLLRPYFKSKGFLVDAEYNREGELDDRVTKVDLKGKALVPDIIVHEHGPKGKNLVAIEVKGYWNHEPRHYDEGSLRRLREKHHYDFLYRIELGKDRASIIPVD